MPAITKPKLDDPDLRTEEEIKELFDGLKYACERLENLETARKQRIFKDLTDKQLIDTVMIELDKFVNVTKDSWNNYSIDEKIESLNKLDKIKDIISE